jgi:predicted nucleic acid-binding protein
MDKIIEISKNHNVFQKVKDVDANNFLITWLIKFNSPKDQADAIIAAMALLSKNNVIPGQMMYQKEISSCEKKMKKVQIILKSA